MKHNTTAAVLSGILPGAGQLYNRQWFKGVGFLVPVLILSAFVRRGMLLPERSTNTMMGLFVIFGLAVWSVVDAYRSGKSTSSH
jgi:hypothetical protein